MRIEPVTRDSERAALEYLTQSPYDNAFITHLLLHDASATTIGRIVLAVDERRHVRGVAYFGRQLALAADEAALDALADYAKRHRGQRMIIGARDTVRLFWERIASWHTRPRVVRDRQLVMVVDRERLQPVERRVTVRHARSSEWAAVADSSAKMIAQELDYDPRRGSVEFVTNVRYMIQHNLWWVGVWNGSLCFFCNIGPWCEQTAQLQGIWTPPELRGQGLATASLAAIADILLDISPTLSLYVNDFNLDAIALYQRVGFEHVSDFQTMLF
jgi:uncharacterized protein